MRLWLINIVHKAAQGSRKTHYVRPKLVMAAARADAVVLALGEEPRQFVLAYSVQSLGDERVYILPSTNMTRAEVKAVRAEPGTAWTFLSDEDVEPAMAPFVLKMPLKLHDDRPSLPAEFSETGFEVGYSDHYIDEHKGHLDEAKMRAKRGVVIGYDFWTAAGKRAEAHDPDGSTIVNVRWDRGNGRGYDPEDEGNGVHHLNLTRFR